MLQGSRNNSGSKPQPSRSSPPAQSCLPQCSLPSSCLPTAPKSHSATWQEHLQPGGSTSSSIWRNRASSMAQICSPVYLQHLELQLGQHQLCQPRWDWALSLSISLICAFKILGCYYYFPAQTYAGRPPQGTSASKWLPLYPMGPMS